LHDDFFEQTFLATYFALLENNSPEKKKIV